MGMFKCILSNWAERKYVCGTTKRLSVQKERGKKKKVRNDLS